MANAEGGYFVVGAMHDKKTERCTGFKTIKNADPIFKKIKDIAAEHIQKRLAIEPVLRTRTMGENLVLAPILKSPKPLAVISNGRAEYWIRVGRDKRPMRHDEIGAAFYKGLTNNSQGTDRQRRLASEPSQWDLITAPEILCEVLDKRFEEEVGTERYLRLTTTPEDLQADRVNTADDSLRNFVWYPIDPSAGQRADGFNFCMHATENPLLATALSPTTLLGSF
jgi:hypothetical protein